MCYIVRGIFILLFLLNVSKTERNKPSKYIFDAKRVFLYEATRLRIDLPPGSPVYQYKFEAFVNGVSSSKTDYTIYVSENVVIRDKTAVWGEDVGDYPFSRNLNFRLVVSINQLNQFFDSLNIQLQLTRSVPIIVKNVRGDHGRINGDFKFMVRCSTHIGINCFLPIASTKNPDVRINKFTGETFCRNKKANPPACNKNHEVPGTNTCKNGGSLIISGGNKYCNCLSGFRGDLCEKYVCSSGCFPPRGQCTKPNTCTCFPGYTGVSCQDATCTNYKLCKNGACGIVNNAPTCLCNSGFFGDFCEYSCNPSCVNGTCYLFDGKTHCQCFPGYSGKACNVADSPIVGATNSKQNKSQATAILIGTLVCISAVCLFCLLIQFNCGVRITKTVKSYMEKEATMGLLNNTNMNNLTIGNNHFANQNHAAGKIQISDSNDGELEAVYDQLNFN